MVVLVKLHTNILLRHLVKKLNVVLVAVQTANQCYDMVVTKHAMTSIGMEIDRVIIQGDDENMNSSELVTAFDDISASFCGKYSLTVTKDCLESMKSSEKIYVTWSFNKKNIKKENDRF